MIDILERVNFISVTKKLGGEKSSPFFMTENEISGANKTYDIAPLNSTFSRAEKKNKNKFGFYKK